MMRFIIILLSLYWFISPINAGNLDKKISLSVKSQPLGQVLKQIEKQANVKFFYMSSVVNSQKKISLAVSNESIRKVLDKLFTNEPIEIKEYGKKIVLSKKTVTKKNDSSIKHPAVIEAQPQSLVKEKENPPTPPVIKPDSVSIDSLSEDKPDSVIIEPDTLFIGSTQIDTITQPSSDIVLKDTIKAIKPKTVRKNPNELSNISVGIYGVYNIVNEKILQKPVAPNSYSQIKSSEDESQFVNFGLSFKYHLNQFSIQTGLGLMQRTWKISFSAPDTGVVIKPADPTKLKAALSQDSMQNQTIETVDNSSLYFQIPLRVNYEVKLKSWIGISAGLGIDYFHLLQVQGKTYVENGIESLSKVLQPNVFRLVGEMSLNFHINTHHSVNLTAGYSTKINRIYQDNDAIDRSFQFIPLGITYYYRF